jgi:hypothetical protein
VCAVLYCNLQAVEAVSSASAYYMLSGAHGARFETRKKCSGRKEYTDWKTISWRAAVICFRRSFMRSEDAIIA